MAAYQGGTLVLADQPLSSSFKQSQVDGSRYVKGLPSLKIRRRKVYKTGSRSVSYSPSLKVNAVATAPPSTSSADFSKDSNLSINEIPMNPPSWAQLTEDTFIGPCPRSPRDLEHLVRSTNIGGLVFLETRDGCRELGLDWEKFREKASHLGVVAVRIAMKEDDVEDQATSLPEAVRAIAALVALGYKVHVSCANGVHRGPLAALGYLTFVKGMEFTHAVQLLSNVNPAAQPYFDAWDEARTKISAGDMKRVSQIAQHVSEKRTKSKKPGTPADDWLIAQRLIVAEAFERGISTDVTLSDAVAKTETNKATRAVLEQLAATKAEAERANQSAMSSKERLEFFTRQLQSMKQMEEEARKSAEVVQKDKEILSHEVSVLKVKEQETARDAELARKQVAFLSAKVAELEEKEAQLISAAEIANSKVKEMQLQVHTAQTNEAMARKEIAAANSRREALAAKFSALEASLSTARVAREEANWKVKEVISEIRAVALEDIDAEHVDGLVADLSKKEAFASAAAVQAQEKFDFLCRQLETLKSKEEGARLAVKAANEKASKLFQQVNDLKLREAMAVNAAQAANKEVVVLKQKIADLEKELKAAKAEASMAKEQFGILDKRVSEAARERMDDAVMQLQNELLLSKKRESEAKGSVVASQDKVDFFYRRMEMMKQREEKAKKVTEERISAFTRQAAELRSKLEMADRLAVENERKIETLSVQVEEISKKEQAAVSAAHAAGERLQFYERHVESLKKKEEAARAAASEASLKAKNLQKKVEDLERREALALSQAESFSEKVTTLMHANSELEMELEEVREREERLLQALDEGTGMLQVAMEADSTIQQLRADAEHAAAELLESRQWADKLAAELERELQKKIRPPPPPTSSPPSRSLEKQLQKQMATMQHSMASATSGLGNPVSMAMKPSVASDGLESMRNLVLGMAAVPITLMSAFAGNNSNMFTGFGSKEATLQLPASIEQTMTDEEQVAYLSDSEEEIQQIAFEEEV